MTMPFQLKERVFLVTGATGGIGAAVARELVGQEASVVVTGRDEARLTSLVQELNRKAPQAFGIPIDLSQAGSAERLVERSAEWKGWLDGLVLCAGAARFTFFQRLAKEEFNTALQVNLVANVDLVRTALPHLIARPPGSVVFINSIASRQPAPPRGTAYLPAKAGLRFFADSLFSEIRDFGIRVSSILPDLTDTNMVPQALHYDRTTLIRPASVARAVIFAMTADNDACVTEIHMRPQPSLRILGGM